MLFSYDTDSGMWDERHGHKELKLDVAIVGAGISGLYSGWRLRTGQFSSGPYRSTRPQTHVFELSERVGGRLLTAFLAGMWHVRCELGGMRYILPDATSTNRLPGHQMVHNLGTKVLGLTSIEFPMGDGNGLYYLRGRRCRVKDILAGFKLPYNLDAWEQRKTDDDLFNEIVKDVLDKAGFPQPQTHEQWNFVKERLKFQGRPTYSLGFWNLLSSYLTSEGYLYLQDINGYKYDELERRGGDPRADWRLRLEH